MSTQLCLRCLSLTLTGCGGINMRISPEGMNELASYEGLSLTPYLDSGGVKTVGIGSTVADIPDIASWSWDKALTIEQATDLYKKSLHKYEALVNRAIQAPVSQHQYDALVSFVYNTGSTNNSVFRRINAGANQSQINQAFMLWVNDNGKRVQGLVNRRKAEIFLYTTGVYKGQVALMSVNNRTHKPSYGESIDLKPYFGAPKQAPPIDTATSKPHWLIELLSNIFLKT